MELKDKYQRLQDIFQKDSAESFSECIMRVVSSSNADEYYDRYCDILPDLSKDELRSIWQFWHSDREDKKQDYTSDSLADVVAALLCAQAGDVIYDCCAGSASLSLGVWRRCKDVSFVCEELDADVVPLQLFNFAVRNIRATIRVCNVLTRECTDQYEITPGYKYGSIQKSLFPDAEIKVTKSISNPPFNLKSGTKPLNYEFVRQCMNNSHKGVFILPTGVLTSQNEEGRQRAELIESGMLKAAITMPGGFFESTGVNVTLLVCDQEKQGEGVMIIDAESLTGIEVREQRGEGDASHRNRIYTKNMRVIRPEKISALCELLNTPTEISTLATYSEIREKKYTLQRGAYMAFEPDAEHSFHRSYSDIVKEMNAIAKARNSFKITINKVWADELGLRGLLELEEQNKQVIDAVNGSLKMLGINEELIYPDYIAQTNSKELVIRQMDKDNLSPVMLSFLPLLTQHIRTMNVFENNLLMELRESLLPALMQGRIRLQDETQ